MYIVFEAKNNETQFKITKNPNDVTGPSDCVWLIPGTYKE